MQDKKGQFSTHHPYKLLKLSDYIFFCTYESLELYLMEEVNKKPTLYNITTLNAVYTYKNVH